MTQEEQLKAKGQALVNQCWKEIKDKLPDEASRKAGYAIVAAMWGLFKQRISTPDVLESYNSDEFEILDTLSMQLVSTFRSVLWGGD